jgi:hypothetical protein
MCCIESGAHPEFFRVGSDPEAVYNLCLILKIVLYTILGGGRPEGRRPLGRPRRRWEDNIKMDLQDMGWGMDWIELAQDRDRWRVLVNAVVNLRVP